MNTALTCFKTYDIRGQLGEASLFGNRSSLSQGSCVAVYIEHLLVDSNPAILGST